MSDRSRALGQIESKADTIFSNLVLLRERGAAPDPDEQPVLRYLFNQAETLAGQIRDLMAEVD
jgi:hypothetical protein